MIGVLLGYFCATGFLVIGAATFPFPILLGRAYGAPVDDAAGLTLVRALGLRDVGLGLALLAHLVTSDLPAAAVMMAVTALISILDFGLVAGLNGRLIPQLGMHAGGFVTGVAGAVLLTLGR